MNKGNGSDQQAKQQQAGQDILLSVQVRADGALNFSSKVPIKDALKLLQNVLLEVMFQELGPKQEGRIVLPNITHGKVPDA